MRSRQRTYSSPASPRARSVARRRRPRSGRPPREREDERAGATGRVSEDVFSWPSGRIPHVRAREAPRCPPRWVLEGADARAGDAEPDATVCDANAAAAGTSKRPTVPRWSTRCLRARLSVVRRRLSARTSSSEPDSVRGGRHETKCLRAGSPFTAAARLACALWQRPQRCSRLGWSALARMARRRPVRALASRRLSSMRVQSSRPTSWLRPSANAATSIDVRVLRSRRD